MFTSSAAVPASTLAFVTTIHVGAALVRKHRSAGRGSAVLLLIPSLACAAIPWVYSTLATLMASLAVQAAWFGACEMLIPSSQPGGAAPARPPAPAPSRAPAAPAASKPPASRPKGFVAVRVLHVFDETREIRTFRLAKPEGFDYTPGQFITVRVQVEGGQRVRCYSISSSPHVSGYLEFSVRRQGEVSGLLHSTVRPGSELMIKSPAGKFVYPDGDDRPIVLVAGGVGITPLMSMLRHGVARDPGRPVTLLYSVRNENEIAFFDELSVLTRRHPQVRVAITITGADGSERFRTGRIDRALVAELVSDPAHSIFLMCGPVPMIESAEQFLADMGVPRAQVRYEVFEAAVAIGAKAAPVDVGADDREEAAVANAAAGTRLVLVKSDRSIEIGCNQSLLDAAEAAGADIPFGCRSGVCGACRTRLVCGDAACSSDALDDEERAEGFVLPCVTYARSDCSLDA
jgi:ferredoxin-NADP reductase